MITSYIIVLALSGWLVAFLLTYVAKRFGKLFGNPLLISPGFVLLLPLLGFLVVVAAPATLLVGCLLLAGSHLTRASGHLPPIAQWGVPLITAILVATHLTLPVIPRVPPLALDAAAMFVLFAYAWSAEHLPARLAPASMPVLAAALPLIATPFFGAPSFIAVDIVILASILLGTNMVAAGNASVAIARQPFGLILGWLTVVAATHGAPIPAAVSVLVYGACLARSFAQPGTELEPYAP